MWIIACFFLLGCAASRTQAVQCPTHLQISSSSMRQYGDTCFLFVDQEISWTSAQRACHSMGGYLAAVPDQGTQDFLVASLRSLNWGHNGVWIGATDHDREGTWVWDNGDPVTYSNWASGQEGRSGRGWFHGELTPNALEDCAQIRLSDRGRWHDYTCATSLTFHYSYICQFAPLTTTTTTTTTTARPKTTLTTTPITTATATRPSTTLTAVTSTVVTTTASKPPLPTTTMKPTTPTTTTPTPSTTTTTTTTSTTRITTSTTTRKPIQIPTTTTITTPPPTTTTTAITRKPTTIRTTKRSTVHMTPPTTTSTTTTSTPITTTTTSTTVTPSTTAKSTTQTTTTPSTTKTTTTATTTTTPAIPTTTTAATSPSTSDTTTPLEELRTLRRVTVPTTATKLPPPTTPMTKTSSSPSVSSTTPTAQRLSLSEGSTKPTARVSRRSSATSAHVTASPAPGHHKLPTTTSRVKSAVTTSSKSAGYVTSAKLLTPKQNAEKQNDSNSAVDKGAMADIVVGAIAGVVVISLLVALLYKSRHKFPRHLFSDQDVSFENYGYGSAVTFQKGADQAIVVKQDYPESKS